MEKNNKKHIISVAADQQQLTQLQLDRIYDQKWFKLFVPTAFDGLNMELPEAIQLQEQLAYMDGSLGWTVTLCAGAAWFAGFMDPLVLESVFLRRDSCLGGSGQATGTAENLPGEGYRIEGVWRYATGAPHLTVFTANCVITEKGVPVVDAYNQPVIRSFFFYPDEVEIMEDWHTMGLQATASHSFKIDHLIVPFHRSFDIHPDRMHWNALIYRYPFELFAEVTLAANHLGMMQHFLDLLPAIDEDKQKFIRNKGIFYSLVEKSWIDLNILGRIGPQLIVEISTCTRSLVHLGQKMALKAYIQSGMYGASQDSSLNRVWRDLMTASQHRIFR